MYDYIYKILEFTKQSILTESLSVVPSACWEIVLWVAWTYPI